MVPEFHQQVVGADVNVANQTCVLTRTVIDNEASDWLADIGENVLLNGQLYF